MITAVPAFTPGLEGIVAAQTRLSHVDGQQGKLIIAGFALEDIAPYATFEEMVYLLWQMALPTRSQLDHLRAELTARRTLSAATLALLEQAAQQRIQPIDALRMGIDTLSVGAAGSHADDALLLLAAAPVIVAAYWRLLNGQTPLAPRDDLHHAANYLYMLFGETPTTNQTRALETYLNTVCDHGLNASTFTARVIISTNSDMISAVVGALGALKGPAHGGAPGPALDTVFEIGKPENAEAVLRAKLERGERLMGFGHRVYRVRDPRADVLLAEAERLFAGHDPEGVYALAKHVEQAALNMLEAHRPGRSLQTNVEFYTALVLHGLHLPTALFTPTFAIGRTAGWTAHCLEQAAANRLIRPASTYTGETGLRWVPVEQRGV